jgi:ankyrin repeat protein
MNEALLQAIRDADAGTVAGLANVQTVDARDDEGRTPLMLAAGLGHGEVVCALLGAGAQVDAADGRGFTALFYACHNGDEDRGYPDVVQTLVAAGADKEAQIGYGVRPLMYAAGHGEAAVVQALLAAGADPLARNEGGRTALMMVKDRDYIDVINILHEAEAVIEAGGCQTRNAPGMQVVTFLKRAPNA